MSNIQSYAKCHGSWTCIGDGYTDNDDSNCKRCTDTDGGQVPTVKGTATDYLGASLTDYCWAGSSQLVEAYCDSATDRVASLLNWCSYYNPDYNACVDGECVECLTATDCKGTDGTYDTFCPLDSPVPDHILPTCVSNVCQCETSCAGNVECASGYCCTGQASQGPGVPPISSACVSKGTAYNQWLCT